MPSRGYCGEEAQKPAEEEAPSKDTTREVSTDEIEERVGVSYVKGEAEPFSGTRIEYSEEGSKKTETHLVDGKRHGMSIWYYEDGSKYSEIPWVKGK